MVEDLGAYEIPGGQARRRGSKANQAKKQHSCKNEKKKYKYKRLGIEGIVDRIDDPKFKSCDGGASARTYTGARRSPIPHKPPDDDNSDRTKHLGHGLFRIAKEN